MKTFLTFFDYLYYRITKSYLKWDGNEGITAIIAVSLLQTLLIGDLTIFIIKLFLNRENMIAVAKIAGGIGIGLFLLLVFLNYFKYRKKFDEFQLKWGDEIKSKSRIRGFLAVIILIFPWVILIYLSRL